MRETYSEKREIQHHSDPVNQANRPASVSSPEPVSQEGAGFEEEDEYEIYMRRQPGENPGPQLDPRDPQMTGDAEYDRKTRITAAHMLYEEQDYRGAIEMARGVLEEEPEHLRTRLLMVLAACGLGTENLAREQWRRLPEAERQRPVAACKRHGVDLTR